MLEIAIVEKVRKNIRVARKLEPKVFFKFFVVREVNDFENFHKPSDVKKIGNVQDFFFAQMRIHPYTFLVLIKTERFEPPPEGFARFGMINGDIKKHESPLSVPVCRMRKANILKQDFLEMRFAFFGELNAGFSVYAFDFLNITMAFQILHRTVQLKIGISV